MGEPERFVGIEDASQFLGVKVSWMYDQVRLGRLPSYRVGKFRRFRLSELEAWAGGSRVSPECPGPPDPLWGEQADA